MEYDKNDRQCFQKLAFAVIKQAYLDLFYKGTNYEGLKIRDEAIQWVISTEDSEGSFVYWCKLAGLDSNTIKNGLLKARVSWDLREKLDNIFKHCQ